MSIPKPFPYVIVIPSYKRANTLRQKTLATLMHHNIEPSRIYIFVADKDEETIYRQTLDPKTYFKIVVAMKGITNVRNYIYDYFPEHTPIVSIDDDIKSFIEYAPNEKRSEKPLSDLEAVIQKGFEECKKNNCRLWGIYPVANGFFMNERITTDLKYIIACFCGFFNPTTKGSKGIQLNKTGYKDDYESSILFYKADGAVVRMNFVAPKTNYYTEPGGLQEFAGSGDIRSPEGILKGAQWIVQTYPEFAKLNLSKKSGKPEIRLKDMRNK